MYGLFPWIIERCSDLSNSYSSRFGNRQLEYSRRIPVMPSNGGEGKNISSFTSSFVDLAVASSSVALAIADTQSPVSSTSTGPASLVPLSH